jgi:carboxyl-terminal processing protease
MGFDKRFNLKQNALKQPIRTLFLIPIFLSFTYAAQSDPYEDLNSGWDRFGEVLSHIVENYYADIENAEIMQAAIEGMVNHLDSHSQFYDEEGLRKLRQDTTGKYAGLGITIAIKDGFPIIISTMEDTPAYFAGIRSGDFIVSIEGLETKNMSLNEIVHELRGEPGSEVNISLASSIGGPYRSISLKRQLIRIHSVAFVENIEPNIGYVSMRETRFSETSANEVKAAVAKVIENGATSLILDLRGNPGGLLNQATQVADLFLPEGAPIVSIRQRDGQYENVKRSKSALATANLPLVVLINESSASASEIVAGAIQDNDSGIILGTTSFGKGSVQTIFEIDKEIDSALKLTTALYYTPSGRSIHRILSGFDRSLDYITVGAHKISPQVLLTLLQSAEDENQALSSIQLLYGLDAITAQNILSLRMRDIIALNRSEINEDTNNLAKSDSVYFTKGGRKVYGGGGIYPDVYVELSKIPRFVKNLERKRVFFDFMVDYFSSESTNGYDISTVDERMLNAFAKYIFKKNLKDEIETDYVRLHIEALLSIADEFGWDEVLNSLQPLSFDLAIKHGLMTKLKPFITSALNRELILRIHGEKALIKHDLLRDNQFNHARQILRDNNKFKKILVEKLSE